MSLFERDKVKVNIYEKLRIKGIEGGNDRLQHSLFKEGFEVIIQGSKTDKSDRYSDSSNLLKLTIGSIEPIGDDIDKYVIVIDQYKKAFVIRRFDNNMIIPRKHLQHVVYYIEESIEDSQILNLTERL